MVGKGHLVKLSWWIALAASLAVVAAPSALGAHVARPLAGNGEAPPSMYDPGVDLSNGVSSDVAQAVQASGFAQTTTPSTGFPSTGTGFDWADLVIGMGLGTALTAFLLGGARPIRRRGIPAA